MRFIGDWASARLESLRPWIETWALSTIFAGAVPQGAPDAVYHLAFQMEYCTLLGENDARGAFDISKFVDQISRDILYMMSVRMGMPTSILKT